VAGVLKIVNDQFGDVGVVFDDKDVRHLKREQMSHLEDIQIVSLPGAA
jgi:hypothetical protein